MKIIYDKKYIKKNRELAKLALKETLKTEQVLRENEKKTNSII